jgi:tRNA threonylcarbamoyladenosine biosynthesis protein TsaB
MKIILSIDTTSNEIIKAGLTINGERYSIEQKLDRQKTQALLPMIEEMLKEKKIKLQDITEIKVNPGPGSFTGIRIGLTIANTLAFLLKVPLNEKPIGEIVEPIY